MKKLKTFLRSLALSCVSLTYYNDVLKAKISFSWKYFFIFITLVSVTLASAACIWMSRFHLPVYIEGVAQALKNTFPEDLEVTFNEQGVRINKDLPYTIPFPDLPDNLLDEEFEDEIKRQIAAEGFDNMIIFVREEDMDTTYRFWDYRSVFLFTPSVLYVPDNSTPGQLQIIPLKNTEPAGYRTFTKADLNKIPIESIKNYWLFQPFFYLSVIWFLIIIFAFLWLAASSLLKLMFAVLIIFTGQYVFRSKKLLSYWKLLQLSLHAFTPLLIIDLFLWFALGRGYLSGFLGLLFFMVWMIVIYYQLEHKTKGKYK